MAVARVSSRQRRSVAVSSVGAACLLVLQLLFRAPSAEAASSFIFTNACQHPVWVGSLHGATSPPLARSGFHLPPSATFQLDAPASGTWSGTFWARTECATDATTGHFSCATADCGSGDVTYDGRGPAPPVSLAEITLAAPGSGAPDFYDISLVDGFNMPMRIAPSSGGTGDCCPAACAPRTSVSRPGPATVWWRARARAMRLVARGTAALASTARRRRAGRPTTRRCSRARARPRTATPTPTTMPAAHSPAPVPTAMISPSALRLD